jgi:hypothetical protein
MFEALKEVYRLRLATDEGTCAQRFDKAWEIAQAALLRALISQKESANAE